MLKLTDEQVDWLAEREPNVAVSPKGGRPATDKRRAIRGVFWILDNGAKWKDLPREFGSKSAVHRWFTHWVTTGVFENTMRDAGELVEERDGYKLYGCFVGATAPGRHRRVRLTLGQPLYLFIRHTRRHETLSPPPTSPVARFTDRLKSDS